jgi:hypothetical protein
MFPNSPALFAADRNKRYFFRSASIKIVAINSNLPAYAAGLALPLLYASFSLSFLGKNNSFSGKEKFIRLALPTSLPNTLPP